MTMGRVEEREVLEATLAPNCQPGETRVDAPGLRHDYRPTRALGDAIIEGDYHCPHCGLKDVTL